MQLSMHLSDRAFQGRCFREPPNTHVTYAIPGEVAGISVLGDCDQKCSASPQLSSWHAEAPTTLPSFSSGNSLPGLSEKQSWYCCFFFFFSIIVWGSKFVSSQKTSDCQLKLRVPFSNAERQATKSGLSPQKERIFSLVYNLTVARGARDGTRNWWN